MMLQLVRSIMNRRFTICRCLLIALAAGILAISTAGAQALSQPNTGPVISTYGPVYRVADPDFKTPTDLTYRVVYDVSQAPEELSAPNRRLETVARFLNMHGRAGVTAEHMKLAVVLHGDAARAALHDAAYRSRFGMINPDRELVLALHEAGVKLLLCGQTAAHRGFSREQLAPEIDLALSAMTALVVLQSEGYALLAF